MKAIEVRDRDALKEMQGVILDEKGQYVRIVWKTDDWFDAFISGHLFKRVKVRGAAIDEESRPSDA